MPDPNLFEHSDHKVSYCLGHLPLLIVAVALL
jgi:hypothetical protein